MLKRKKYLIKLAFTALLFFSCPNKSTKVIDDFESASYAGWKTEGNAFKNGPSSSEDYIGALGSRIASSEYPDDETATGRLTSEPFTIEMKSIHFLLGAQEIHFMGDFKMNDDLAVQLLIDDQVVRSMIPTRFHAMFWEGWDVSEFIGKEAQFRIVDNDDRRGAHLAVDQIVQIDLPPDGKIIEREMTVTNPKLNFPVNENYQRYYVEIFVNGEQIRGIDVAIAPEEDIDYWVVNDLSEWNGEEITIHTKQFGVNDSDILESLTLAHSILDSDDLYKEPLRSQFHFSSKRGWINDPNGLVYYDGKFHLLYQHNPFGWDHSRNDYNKTWGHAVSTDLVHWKELPAAVNPDHLGSIYSGSAVVDEYNTTGFKGGEEDPIVLVYTSVGSRSHWSLGEKFTQSISYSTDGGRTFTKYPGNPVQENLGYINRDPKAIWHEPDNRWVIILYLYHGEFVFFTSEDLKSWQEQSRLPIQSFGVTEIGAFEDCPELFELPVDGNPKNTKWILYAGAGDYVLGDFDGKKFTPQSELIKYDYGDAFYASQTFNNVPESDGRRIQIAWGTIDTPGMPFNQIMLFPVSLTLRNTEKGPHLYAYPVEEIEKLYADEHSWDDLIVEGERVLSELKGELFDINAEFTLGEAEEFGFIINGQKISYDLKDNILYGNEVESPLKPENGKINLRILVDRVSVEIFANNGRVYMPLYADFSESESGVKVFSQNGSVTLSS